MYFIDNVVSQCNSLLFMSADETSDFGKNTCFLWTVEFITATERINQAG